MVNMSTSSKLGNKRMTPAKARAKRIAANPAIEAGDYVTMLDGNEAGMVGVLDNVFGVDGVTTYAVVSESDSDVFWYVTKIELFDKAH